MGFYPMSNELWRWAGPGGEQRKVQLDELRAALAGGQIAPNAPVWRPGWKTWQPAHEVAELTSTAPGANGGVIDIPPPPLAVLVVQHELEARAGESFRPPPVTSSAADEEPPPPPTYVPAPAQMKFGMPTTVGLPPPLEMAAGVAVAKKGPTKPPPPQNRSRPDPNEMVEELSGSMLLSDESVGKFGAPGESDPGGMPPPTDPVRYPSKRPSFFDELKGGPTQVSPLVQLRSDLFEMRAGRPPKNKRLVVVAGVVLGSTLLVFLAVFVSLVRAVFGGSSDAHGVSAATSASGAASSAPSSTPSSEVAAAVATAVATTPVATAVPPKEEPRAAGIAHGDCLVTGDAKAIGWRAVVPIGVEATAYSGTLAIGFASSGRDGVAVSLDPSTFAPTATVKMRALGGEAKRVTPLLAQGKLAAVTDADRRGDALIGRRVAATIPAIDVGVADKAIAWAPHGKDSWAKLFPLEGEGPVEALRAVPLAGTKGIAIAFRRAGAIWVGSAKGEAVLEPQGGLQRIAGLGQVGSPTIAASGDTLMIAWADRAEDAWQVRWTTASPGGAPAEPRTFALPDGGPGGQAMSPSLAPLGGGRFLLAWTEGPVSSHAVRALTVGADGTPSGGSLAISPPGINAGQSQAAVGPDGKGLVAFLAAKAKANEVYATPVSCAAK